MERPILSSLLFAVAFGASAHLAPTADAPLYQHMLEVNKEWRTMDAALAADTRPVHFTCESERIAMHLFLVRAYLQAHAPEGLSPEAAVERAAMLAELGTYAGRGVFPINDVVDHRNPVFIDRIGTACAVGHLIIASGHGDISRSIHDATNLAYVSELHRADLMDWAVTHGFTKNELAWVQPGYPSVVPWTSLAGGTNEAVTTLALVGETLFVGGDFTACDTTVSALHAATFDGTSYTAMGNGVDGNVTCSTVLNGRIYVGGSAMPGGSDLGWWDGGTWQYADVFSGKFPVITALHVHDGELYAAGTRLGFAGADHFVQRLHNGNWEQVGELLNGPVNALATHNGTLVAGGAFTQLAAQGGLLIPHVARLDGNSWMVLGDGLDATVNTFLTVGSELYAGGELWDGSTPTFGLALLTDDVASWIPQFPDHSMYLPDQGGTSIHALAASQQGIYFGGSFSVFEGMEFGSNVGLCTGPDAVQAVGGLDGRVNVLTILSGKLIAGGGFSNASFLASTDLATGIDDNGVLSIGIGVRPNPANGPVMITLDRDATAGAALDVLDASGRLVMAPIALRGRTSTLDVASLPEGPYLLRVRMDGTTAVSRFVKL